MDYDVIESKPWVDGGEGCYPARVVLLKINKGGRTEWSTHIQYDAAQDGRQKHVAHGHYFETVWDAAMDFKKREV